MKQKTIRVDARIYEAAKARLAETYWSNLDFAVEYFLAECVVRKNLPAFMNHKTHNSCAVCKFYEPIHAENFKKKMADFRKKAKSGKYFTALLHPTREGGYWCEIPAFNGCSSCGTTLEEAKSMIKDAALVWLDLKDVNLRYRIERENKDDAELLMFNTPEAASAYINGKNPA